MSLILKQEPANTISTPPAGKSTLFVTDQNVMAVKSPAGTVTTFPTVQGANTQVLYNDDGSLNGNANLTFDKTTGTLTALNVSVTGTLNAGDISVSSIANGTSNVDIVGVGGNVTTSVGGNANIFVVTGTGANIAGTLNVSGAISLTGNANVGNIAGTGGAQFTTLTGGLTTASQPNITSVGTLTSASVSGNANVGNLGTGGLITVTGNANVGNLGTTGLIIAGGNITGGNILTGGLMSAGGNISASFFLGNGSQLTGIDATSIQNGNSNVRVYPNTIVTTSVAGNANVFEVTGTGIQANGTISATGNINGANLGTGGVVTATGNVTGGNVVTAGSVFAPAIVANSGAYNTSLTLNTTTGIIEANSQGNATQFLPAGQIRINGGTPIIMSGTNDGSQLVLNTTETKLNQLQAGNVKVSVGTGGTVTNVWDFGNDGNLAAPGAISAPGNVTGGNIITGGVVSATGNITGNFFIGNGSQLTGIDATSIQSGNSNVKVYANANVTVSSAGVSNVFIVTSTGANVAGTLSASGNATFGNVTATLHVGNLSGTGNSNVGNLGATGVFATTLSASGNANVGNIGATGVVATTLGGALTTAAQPNITSTGTLTSVSVSGNANVGNIGGTAGLFTTVAGSLTTAAQPNITSTGTLASLSVTGTATTGNLATGGTLSVGGNANVGNLGTTTLVATGAGSFGANVNMNGNWLTNVGYAVANTDAASKLYVDTLSSSGISYHQPVAVATTTTLAVATGGTTAYNSPNGAANGIGAYISTTGTFLNIDSANVQTVGTRILVKNEANATWNGVYTYANTTAVVRSTDTDEYGPDSTSQLSINDYFFVTGGVVNEGTAFIVSAPAGVITFGTSNITFSTFSTSQVYDAGTGIAITGTTISANASQTQITAVGTLTSLSISGNANIGNIGAAAGIFTTVSATGNANVGNLFSTAAVQGTTLTSNIATGTAPLTVTSTTLVPNLYVSRANVSDYDIVTASTTGNYYLGMWTATSGNLQNYANSVFVANASNGALTATTFVGALSGAATSATTAGTVTTAAQPNITSTGTLTTLSVSGNANVGNIGATNVVGTLTTASQTNITAIGTLASLSVTANANIGNIGTALITATGNITGANLITGGILTVTGNATVGNLIAGSGTGGNITGANLVSANYFTGTLTTAAQPNITSVGTLASLSVTANANIGNIGTAGILTVTGNANIGNIGTAGIITATGNANVGNIGATGGYYTTLSATGNITAGNISATNHTGTTVSITGNVTAGNVTLANAAVISANNMQITTGANTNAGNVTGNFVLTTGSRFQATYA